MREVEPKRSQTNSKKKEGEVEISKSSFFLDIVESVAPTQQVPQISISGFDGAEKI